jgi:hypothetical protein
MADITTLRIKSPYGIESILTLSFSVRPNEHAVLRLTGLCNEEAGFAPLLSRSCESDTIELYETREGDKKNTIFYGFVRSLAISRKRSVYTIELEAHSGTTTLDEKNKSRSFQDIETNFDGLVSDVAEDMQVLFHEGYGESIKTPAIQYKETDWAFLLRMASRLNIVLYPDIVTPNLHFGLPDGEKRELPNVARIDSVKDLKGYVLAKASGAELHDMNFFAYHIRSKEIFFIGDTVCVEGIPLRITTFFAELIDGDLIFEYTVAIEESVWRETRLAPLKGLSLEGRVLEASGEMLKLHLDIDEAQEKEKAYPYSYAPITGNPMYCMPIVGTKARLYFPDGREENAFVQDCVRENGSLCSETSDPNTRYFRTEHGKELMMAPDKLHFKETASSGGGLFFELDDNFGIRMLSPSNMNMDAGGSLTISAGGSVSFSAPENILFVQTKVMQSGRGQRFKVPEANLSLENETHVKAKTTIYRGLSRTSYMPFANALTAVSANKSSPVRMEKSKTSEGKQGFNWAGLLIAAVAVIVVVAVVAVATGGAGLPLLIGAATGAFCAMGMSALRDYKENRYRSAAEYLKVALLGGSVGISTGAASALIGVGSILLSPLFLLTGCEVEEEEVADSEPEESEKNTDEIEAESEAASNDTPEATVVNDWFTVHSEPSQSEDMIVRKVDFRENSKIGQEREKLRNKYKEVKGVWPEWYAPESTPKNFNPRGKTMELDNSGSVYLDEENGRYRVAVGPRVTNPDYKYGDIIGSEQTYGENKTGIENNTGPGIKLDLMLEQLDEKHKPTGKFVYAYATTGDVKGHTGTGEITFDGLSFINIDGMGYFQTGISTRTGDVVGKNTDGSMVEFMTLPAPYELNMSGMGDYRLVEIIVYKEDQ